MCLPLPTFSGKIGESFAQFKSHFESWKNLQRPALTTLQLSSTLLLSLPPSSTSLSYLLSHGWNPSLSTYEEGLSLLEDEFGCEEKVELQRLAATNRLKLRLFRDEGREMEMVQDMLDEVEPLMIAAGVWDDMEKIEVLSSCFSSGFSIICKRLKEVKTYQEGVKAALCWEADLIKAKRMEDFRTLENSSTSSKQSVLNSILASIAPSIPPSNSQSTVLTLPSEGGTVDPDSATKDPEPTAEMPSNINGVAHEIEDGREAELKGSTDSSEANSNETLGYSQVVPGGSVFDVDLASEANHSKRSSANNSTNTFGDPQSSSPAHSPPASVLWPSPNGPSPPITVTTLNPSRENSHGGSSTIANIIDSTFSAQQIPFPTPPIPTSLTQQQQQQQPTPPTKRTSLKLSTWRFSKTTSPPQSPTKAESSEGTEGSPTTSWESRVLRNNSSSNRGSRPASLSMQLRSIQARTQVDMSLKPFILPARPSSAPHHPQSFPDPMDGDRRHSGEVWTPRLSMAGQAEPENGPREESDMDLVITVPSSGRTIHTATSLDSFHTVPAKSPSTDPNSPEFRTPASPRVPTSPSSVCTILSPQPKQERFEETLQRDGSPIHIHADEAGRKPESPVPSITIVDLRSRRRRTTSVPGEGPTRQPPREFSPLSPISLIDYGSGTEQQRYSLAQSMESTGSNRSSFDFRTSSNGQFANSYSPVSPATDAVDNGVQPHANSPTTSISAVSISAASTQTTPVRSPSSANLPDLSELGIVVNDGNNDTVAFTVPDLPPKSPRRPPVNLLAHARRLSGPPGLSQIPILQRVPSQRRKPPPSSLGLSDEAVLEESEHSHTTEPRQEQSPSLTASSSKLPVAAPPYRSNSLTSRSGLLAEGAEQDRYGRVAGVTFSEQVSDYGNKGPSGGRDTGGKLKRRATAPNQRKGDVKVSGLAPPNGNAVVGGSVEGSSDYGDHSDKSESKLTGAGLGGEEMGVNSGGDRTFRSLSFRRKKWGSFFGRRSKVDGDLEGR